MSATIVRRPHVHVPWLLIIVVLAIAAAAALVVLLSIPATTTRTAGPSAETVGTAAASVRAVDVHRDRSPVVRAIVFGEMPAAAPAQATASLRKSLHTPWLAGERAVPHGRAQSGAPAGISAATPRETRGSSPEAQGAFRRLK